MPITVKSKALSLGIFASVFFATTFVLNRMMAVSGGGWQWSAALRFVWMLPILLLIVLARGNLKQLLVEMSKNIGQWLLWSTIGFGLFYALLTFGASYGPSWLVAGTFEFTIIAGMFIGPLLQRRKERQPISKAVLFFSSIIFLGIMVMQMAEAKSTSWSVLLLGTIPVLIAAIAYPLGNRKMMILTQGSLDTYQRTLGMTIASMPFWIILMLFGYHEYGLPGQDQLLQTLLVAIFAGVIATLLFFKGTELIQHDHKALAAVEATQAMEVIFTLIGEIIILHSPFPSYLALTGIFLVVIGMYLHGKNN
ncbi:multidrug resistance efflux transporter family protein [Sphingobacterium sp. SRCM116780]|uniref:DMT family transporter n=1 Tax=Sphingobacterium sp. SRCM116780 TaxID=2907623 RepID=UPI001F2FAE92|nr:multidrug resistance efflux transporter family protein [Sphingobacterium sp. SRCM116780]UIR57155.1 multidrug resistance efflux transporter family protein [Sphingobacterium sp. SRCM116780]